MRNSYYDKEVFIFMHFWHISEKKILLIASLWNWGFSEELGNCLLIVKPVNTLVSFGVLLRLCLFLILLNCNVTVSCCESNLSTHKIKKKLTLASILSLSVISPRHLKNSLVLILFEQNSSQLVSSNWALKNVLWPLGHASLLVASNVNAFKFSWGKSA